MSGYKDEGGAESKAGMKRMLGRKAEEVNCKLKGGL